MEDKTKSGTNEMDALTMRYNAMLEERGRDAPAFGDIESTQR